MTNEPEPAPLLTIGDASDAQAGETPPLGGQAVWLRASDGARLRAAFWPGGPRGWIALFNGRTEFIEKYYEVVARLRVSGFSVATLDWRGQGLSDRAHADPRLGHVAHFAEYQLDVDAFLNELGRRAGAAPLALIAHSMGGLIGARTLMRQAGLGRRATPSPAHFRAAALSAPFLGLAGSASLRAAAPVVAGAMRGFGAGGRYATGGPAHYVLKTPFEKNSLTSDAARYRRIGRFIEAHPDLAVGGPSWTWLAAAAAELRAIRPTPIVGAVLLGDQDTVVSQPIAKRYAARSPNMEIVLLAGARHEPLIESDPIRNAAFAALEAIWARAGGFER